jgi:SulP family sulfate permease
MLVTVAATISTGNLAIGVLAGMIAMAILPARLHKARGATAEKSSPAQEK